MLSYMWLATKVSVAVAALLIASPRLGASTAVVFYAAAILLMFPSRFSDGMADGLRWMAPKLATLGLGVILTGLFTEFRWTTPMSDLGVVVILGLIAVWAAREGMAIRSAREPTSS